MDDQYPGIINMKQDLSEEDYQRIRDDFNRTIESYRQIEAEMNKTFLFTALIPGAHLATTPAVWKPPKKKKWWTNR